MAEEVGAAPTTPSRAAGLANLCGHLTIRVPSVEEGAGNAPDPFGPLAFQARVGTRPRRLPRREVVSRHTLAGRWCSKPRRALARVSLRCGWMEEGGGNAPHPVGPSAFEAAAGTCHASPSDLLTWDKLVVD